MKPNDIQSDEQVTRTLSRTSKANGKKLSAYRPCWGIWADRTDAQIKRLRKRIRIRPL